MKKLNLAILLTILLSVFSFSFVYASSDNVTESPDINIIIDGSKTTNTNVPIIINSRTMLPLRELLTKLGVQDDNQHIIWNDSEKSVTILKDTTKIYLKVGNTTAYVNDSPVNLDTAPVIYEKNSRTYIPVRFVAQTLGKVVVWDSNTRSALIRNQNDINDIKSIFNNVNEADKLTAKVKCNIDIPAKITINKMDSINANIDGTAEFDENNKAMHMLLNTKINILPISMKFESYSLNNNVYAKGPTSSKWEKSSIADNALLNEILDGVDISDELCVGFVKAEGSNPDEIIIKGNIIDIDKINKGLSNFNIDLNFIKIKNLKIKNLYMEITINTKTNQIEKWNTKASMTAQDSTNVANTAYEIDVQPTITYDYKSDFTIQIPDELK